jgi:hypothetical protein
MTSHAPTAPRSTRPGGFAPVLVRGLLTCLSLTALLGIVAVASASFGETSVRVLTSTLLIGLYCMLCLADTSVLDTRYRAVGAAGISAASTALAQGLFLIWSVGDEVPGDTLWLVARGFLLTAVVSFALAHAALVLRLDVTVPSTAARIRTATLVLVGAVAALLGAAVVHPELAEGGAYWRLLGVLAILDVLGTACLPVLARLDARSTR